MSRIVPIGPELFHSVAEQIAARRTNRSYCMVGTYPVLFTSTHGFDHIRDGKKKAADTGTLEFSYLCAQASRASWLAVAEPNLDDSNHHRDTDFKTDLATFIKTHGIELVVDIHASHAFRPHDVDIGSLYRKTWIGKLDWRNVLFDELKACGFLATDNEVFSGSGSSAEAETIIAFCYELGVPSVQLEISSAYLADLDTRLGCHLRAKLIFALSRFVAGLY